MVKQRFVIFSLSGATWLLTLVLTLALSILLGNASPSIAGGGDGWPLAESVDGYWVSDNDTGMGVPEGPLNLKNIKTTGSHITGLLRIPNIWQVHDSDCDQKFYPFTGERREGGKKLFIKITLNDGGCSTATLDLEWKGGKWKGILYLDWEGNYGGRAELSP